MKSDAEKLLIGRPATQISSTSNKLIQYLIELALGVRSNTKFHPARSLAVFVARLSVNEVTR
jgi:hypothetical protein